MARVFLNSKIPVDQTLLFLREYGYYCPLTEDKSGIIVSLSQGDLAAHPRVETVYKDGEASYFASDPE